MWSMSLLKVGIVGSGGLQSCSVKFSISARVESTRPLGNLLLYLTAETVKDIDMLVQVLHLKSAEYRGKNTSLDLLASLLHRKPNIQLGCFPQGHTADSGTAVVHQDPKVLFGRAAF